VSYLVLIVPWHINHGVADHQNHGQQPP
jgi:hypothetical protein